MKLQRAEKIWLLITALCVTAAVAVTAAGRTASGAADAALVPMSVSAAPAQSAAGEKLDLNTATAAQLEALPGIGEMRAQRIIAYRAANGPFEDADDIMEVPGIGAGKYEQIRDSVTVTQEGGT